MNDEWFNALAAVSGVACRKYKEIRKDKGGNPIFEKIGKPIYDPKPLATLLRDGAPPPREACLMLAEFLDPPKKFPCTNMRLVPRPIVTEQKEFELHQSIQMVGEYYRLKAEGKSSSEAIEHIQCGRKAQWASESAFFKIRQRTLAFLSGLKSTGKN